MPHLIGYARVSTADQTTTMQLDALNAVGCTRIFSETASGARSGRPELTAALDYMREGDTLVVWKLDRLARSLTQLIETVDSLRKRGIELRSLSETIDTTTSAGRLTFNLFGALAEFERDVIRDRTKAGLEAARARGRKGGRPRKLNEKDLMVARAMLSADPPVSFAETARRLKVSPATLYGYFPVNQRPVPNGFQSDPELPLEAPVA
ncbi:recombinase family protein [Agrobacterium rosae]|uniref:DNA-invertase hin n=1 Tax=Agrobacterium rosae TaxID=1972867 RepID=A0A1R3U2R9_9HYPH|nr:recombinase family protein [Agrobacterium rosae]SCX35856.1 DNA-invertase hin [Agrobacterium rosae]